MLYNRHRERYRQQVQSKIHLHTYMPNVLRYLQQSKCRQRVNVLDLDLWSIQDLQETFMDRNISQEVRITIRGRK